MIRRLGSVLMVMGLLVASSLNVVADEAKVRVFVSVLPQKTFVERIGGDRVDVGVLVSPGESPATYRPRPSLVAKLVASDIYFRVGVPFETHLMPKIQSMAGDLRVVDTRAGVTLLAMGEDQHHDDEDHNKVHQGHEKEHGEARDEHDSEGMDPHIWLDPLRVIIQAATMRDALTAVDPEGEEIYAAGYDALARELMALNQHVAEALTPLKGDTLYVFHPAFGYFADAYGMVQKAVEVEGKSPKGKALALFIQQARDEEVRVIFVQPQFDRAAAAKVAVAVGGAVVPLDPLAQDYFENLRHMADAVAAGLKQKE